jgi:hypothetical protein
VCHPLFPARRSSTDVGRASRTCFSTARIRSWSGDDGPISISMSSRSKAVDISDANEVPGSSSAISPIGVSLTHSVCRAPQAEVVVTHDDVGLL